MAIFSMSCHTGLNVPPNASTNDLDLVQAFAQKGVVAYIAPTSFGIGSPRTRAAHELLLSYFTRYLYEGTDAGTALRRRASVRSQKINLAEGDMDIPSNTHESIAWCCYDQCEIPNRSTF